MNRKGTCRRHCLLRLATGRATKKSSPRVKTLLKATPRRGMCPSRSHFPSPLYHASCLMMDCSNDLRRHICLGLFTTG